MSHRCLLKRIRTESEVKSLVVRSVKKTGHFKNNCPLNQQDKNSQCKPRKVDKSRSALFTAFDELKI